MSNKIEEQAHEVVRSNSIQAALYTIYSRAIPGLPDGLKSGQRRLIYSEYDLGLKPSGSTTKSTRVTSNCQGHYHPHGDAALYETLANMTSDFSVSVSPFYGHGNWGFFGYQEAAARYTETRMSQAGWLLVDDIPHGATQMIPNFDGTKLEPRYLPAKWPFLAFNGGSGIATGYACVHIPFNSTEVMKLATLLAGATDKVPLKEIKKIIKGPDYPSGETIIIDDSTIEDLLLRGEGKFIARGVTKIDQLQRGKTSITIKALPYKVRNESFVAKVKDLVRNSELDGIAGVDDLSDRKRGTNIYIELKKGFDPELILENLYALTPLETAVSANANVINEDGDLEKVGLIRLVRSFLDMRVDAIRRAHTNEKESREKRLRLVNGLLAVLLDIDKAITIIRGSNTADTAQKKLSKEFGIDEEQATHVLALQLRRLTKMDSAELKKEKKSIEGRIKEIDKVLLNEKHLKEAVLVPELEATALVVAKERKSKIVKGKVKTSSPVKPEKIELGSFFIIPTEKGVRRLSRNSGGGIAFEGNNEIIGVTDSGYVGLISPLSITDKPSNDILARGKYDASTGNFLHFFKQDSPQIFLAVMVDDSGVKVKRTVPEPNKSGLKAIAPNISDAVFVAPWDENQRVLVILRDGKVHKFDPSSVNEQGMAGQGVAGNGSAISASDILSILVATDEDVIETVTNATRKATSVADIPVKGRTSNGVVVHKFLKADKEVLEVSIGSALKTTARGASGSKI